MSITITENAEKEEIKTVEKEVVETALKAVKDVDDAERLKVENDALELQVRRKQELMARLAVGGTTEAGQEKNPELEAREEAERILRTFQTD